MTDNVNHPAHYETGKFECIEVIMCIRYHMGAFCDKSEWNDYTRAVHKYTNVLWTHQADMLASHVEGV